MNTLFLHVVPDPLAQSHPLPTPLCATRFYWSPGWEGWSGLAGFMFMATAVWSVALDFEDGNILLDSEDRKRVGGLV